MIVLDASAILAVVLDEPESLLVDDLLKGFSGEGFIAPANWPSEIANGLRSAVMRKRISSAVREAAALRADSIDIKLVVVEGYERVVGAVSASAAFGLTPYDAAYVLLAKTKGYALVTLDAEMRRAALAAGITVHPA